MASGLAQAERAAQLAVEDQSVDATDVRVQYAPDGADCEAAGSYTPTLMPAERFSVCVTVTTATGQFVVERDRYVDG